MKACKRQMPHNSQIFSRLFMPLPTYKYSKILQWLSFQHSNNPNYVSVIKSVMWSVFGWICLKWRRKMTTAISKRSLVIIENCPFKNDIISREELQSFRNSVKYWSHMARSSFLCFLIKLQNNLILIFLSEENEIVYFETKYLLD